MNLKDLVQDGKILLAMRPEDLSMYVLGSLNAIDNTSRRGGFGRPENFSLSNYCNAQAQLYTNAPHDECAMVNAAAFQYLVTTGMLVPNPASHPFGWFVLTPRARSIKTDADHTRHAHAAKYPRDVIHPLIEKNTFSEFMSGDYDTAVFKAFKTLEDLVRRQARLGSEKIGVPLMRLAFHPASGPLTDKTEHEGEREALMHLMAGAIGRFKNPTSHRFTGLDDPVATIEILQLASSLVRLAACRLSPSNTR